MILKVCFEYLYLFDVNPSFLNVMFVNYRNNYSFFLLFEFLNRNLMLTPRTHLGGGEIKA